MAGYLVHLQWSHGGRTSRLTWSSIPVKVLYPGAVWVHLLSHIRNTRVKPTTKPVFQQKNKTYSAASHGHWFPHRAASLYRLQSRCPVLLQLLQGLVPCGVCALTASGLPCMQAVGLSMASSPHEEVQVTTPQYPPGLGRTLFADSLMAIPEGSTKHKATHRLQCHSNHQEDDIVPMRVYKPNFPWMLGFYLGSSVTEET